MSKYRSFKYRSFRYFSEPGGAAHPPAEKFLEALRTYLVGQSTLSALTDVYLFSLRAKWSLPAMILNPIGSTFDLTTKRGKIAYPEVQFSVLSDDGSQAWDLGEAAFACLDHDRDPAEGGYVKVRFLGGTEADRWPMFAHRMSEQPGRSRNNLPIWVYSFSYQFMLSV